VTATPHDLKLFGGSLANRKNVVDRNAWERVERRIKPTTELVSNSKADDRPTMSDNRRCRPEI
jgi:hypothetical protein